MTIAPPLAGALHDTAKVPLPGSTARSEGALGVDRGVTDADANENEPVPTEFTAATRKIYATPLVNDVTELVATEDTPSEKVVQVAPESADTCTM